MEIYFTVYSYYNVHIYMNDINFIIIDNTARKLQRVKLIIYNIERRKSGKKGEQRKYKEDKKEQYYYYY